MAFFEMLQQILSDWCNGRSPTIQIEMNCLHPVWDERNLGSFRNCTTYLTLEVAKTNAIRKKARQRERAFSFTLGIVCLFASYANTYALDE